MQLTNGYRRYCLWLGDCSPSELRKMPEAMKREAVRQLVTIHAIHAPPHLTAPPVVIAAKARVPS